MSAPVLAALLLTSADYSDAIPIGAKSCAEAEVIAKIEDQSWETPTSSNPNVLIVDGVDHIRIKVERVVRGPVSIGEMHVSAVMHTYLDGRIPRFRFFLRKNGGIWWVAQCKSQ